MDNLTNDINTHKMVVTTTISPGSWFQYQSLNFLRSANYLSLNVSVCTYGIDNRAFRVVKQSYFELKNFYHPTLSFKLYWFPIFPEQYYVISLVLPDLPIFQNLPLKNSHEESHALFFL